MKIYFEDGELRHNTQIPFEPDLVVRASSGVSQNIEMLNLFTKYQPDATVYTNSIIAFSNIYAWNKELKVPEVYIRAGEHMSFIRIDKLTTRELREGHNLAKMYIAGEFVHTEVMDIVECNVKNTLSGLDTSKIHFVKVPENHIVIDFDIKDDSGNKSFEKNLAHKGYHLRICIIDETVNDERV